MISFKHFLQEINEAKKITAGTTADELFKGWNLRYELKPKDGSKEFRGFAVHTKASKTAPIQVSGNSPEDVLMKLKDTIVNNKGRNEITSKNVIVSFNVGLVKDIIGHSDDIYSNIIKKNNKIVLLVSNEKHNGLKLATDRSGAEAKNNPNNTGLQRFVLSGKDARDAGLTHARYTIGAPMTYTKGVSAFELEYNSDVNPGEKVLMGAPGVTISYTKD